MTQKITFDEDEALSLAERTFSTEIDEQLASDIIQYARRLHNRYTTLQPAPNKLNADREQVTEVDAPSHSLPDWSECNLRVGNSEWLKDNDRKPEHDSLTANPLHEFIYEYDDSDAYKSAWFLHRLEKLIGFIKSEQVPTSDVAALVEALEEIINPVRFMQERLEEGEQLNGMAAIQLAKDPEYLKDIAKAALTNYHKHKGDL